MDQSQVHVTPSQIPTLGSKQTSKLFIVRLVSPVSKQFLDPVDTGSDTAVLACGSQGRTSSLSVQLSLSQLLDPVLASPFFRLGEMIQVEA